MDLGCINVITLAYIGDAVYELYIREMYLEKGIYKILVGDKAGNTIEESIKISGIKDISIKDTQKPKMFYN